MTALLTAAEVAERLSITEDQVKRRTVRDSWPCVRFSGKTIRYREDQVDAIVARYTKTAPEPVSVTTGQTARSRRRSA